MRRNTWRIGLAAMITMNGFGWAQSLPPVSSPITSTAPATAGVEATDDGLIAAVRGGFVKLSVRSPRVVRVMFAPDRAFFARRSLVVVPPPADARAAFRVTHGDEGPTLDTGVVRASLDLASGRVSFFDGLGKPLLAEADRTMEPAVVQGEPTYHVHQTWQPHDNESLYGLGQHQFDAINLKGLSVDLWQRNTSIVVPLLVSSRGYGVFWDDLAYTRFGDLRPWQPLSGAEFDGGVVGHYFGDATFTKEVATRADGKVEFDFFNNRDLVTADGTPANAAPANAAPATRPATGPGGGGGGGNRRRSNAGLHPDLPAGDVSVRWESTFVPQRSGVYQFRNYSNAGAKLVVGDTVVFDHWRQGWLPAEDVGKVRLEAGQRYPFKAEWTKDGQGNVFKLDYKAPPEGDEPTSLWSEVGEGIDYSFVYGPDIDGVVGGMRELTGRATLPPQWAFGLWQSRQRYETQQASLDAVDGFRKRGIPFDNIVQDWQYWRRDQWGSHQFDADRFPDPVGWVNAVHEKHARLMISVWGKFYKGVGHYDELQKNGYLYPLNIKLATRDFVGFPFTNYDAFNPAARAMFWRQMREELFDKGVDAWWMDATEPDLEGTPTLVGLHQRMNPTAAGTGASVLNGYALQNARAVYEGQRQAAPDQRVFNLTRSGYAGQQRYGAASWSGDISSTWTAMRKQIPAGLGFCLSGVPYWTMDSGGFSVPARFNARNASPEAVDEWRELNTRWFQFATFVPLLRVHGENPLREMWEFGGETSEAYKAQLKFDQLRYRMLPYTYSLAGDVTQKGGTIMRAMPFDFANDPLARDLTDQYLFGPSLLVCPVTTYKARTRSVYLPAGVAWYDLWTGTQQDGGRRIDAAAPYDAIPLYAKAGSILPLGPAIQYTAEKPADPLTVFVYTGGDADFSLYEDDGLTNGYERNAFSRIPMRWDESRRTLTVGQRSGQFPGMLAKRTINVVFVTPKQAKPLDPDAKPDQTVSYDGHAVAVRAE